jgi:hypothetical protein
VDAEIDQASAHREQAWNFTNQPGWNSQLTIDSVTITETFILILSGGTPPSPNFQSTFISDTGDLSTQSAIFTIFAAEAPANTKTITLTPGVGGFSDADISSGGALGEFATRVARNGGGFFLESVTVTIDASTPEPAAFALMGLGLLAFAIYRPVTSRITRR